MKVIVSAQGNDIDSLVDPRFGRCCWLIVTETQTGEWRSLDNKANADASGGAGVQAGSMVVAEQAETLITGNLGPNAQRVLNEAGIVTYQAHNGVTVRAALAAFAAGELARIDGPTVAGHWS